ncbi:hypothetical protein [Flexivirga caeni]|uniref:hypothetical protein n=1 Tax=Flexivirga caeni TaxID=2294115 RepID=UPI0011CEA9B3|nr:hypothetical protein [Flexivirga caeni]
MGVVSSKSTSGTQAGSESPRLKLTGSGGTCSKLAAAATSEGIISGKPSARAAVAFVKTGSPTGKDSATTETVQQFSSGATPAAQLAKLQQWVSGYHAPLKDAAAGVSVTVKLANGASPYGDKTVIVTETESKSGVTVVTTLVGIAAGKNYLQINTLGASSTQVRELAAAAWKQANHPRSGSSGASV